jgi:hypothetical protein
MEIDPPAGAGPSGTDATAPEGQAQPQPQAAKQETVPWDLEFIKVEQSVLFEIILSA